MKKNIEILKENNFTVIIVSREEKMAKAVLELPEMPESCRKCKLSKWETWEYDIDTWTNVLVCAALGEECSDKGRRPDCPLKLVEDKEVE